MSCPEDRKNNKTDSEKQENEAAKHAKPIEVHSANAWETADLGDDDRKNKFLRLMGAGKKDHHGRFVIGDQEQSQARGGCNTAEVQHNLEEQYQQSLAHRLQGGRRGHIGLGFHEEEEDQNAKEGKDETNTPEDTNKDIVPEKAAEEEDDNYEKSEEEEKEEEREEEEGEEEEGEEEEEDKASKRNAKKRESTEESNPDSPSEKKMKFLKATS